MLKIIRGFLVEEKGQGMVEYGLILAVIAIGVLAVLSGIGTKVVAKIQELSDSII
ncbi:MAG: Flp family type IVb pilin [Syntrophomonas sp.]